MPKDKDRTLNPAAAQRKLEKQKALKKGKATVLAQRTSRLAARNPVRLERQIAELKALETDSGKPLKAREKKQLEDAERDLARVKKARETVGAPTAAGGGRGGRTGAGGGRDGERGRGGGGLLGKRTRESTWARDSDESEDTDESVRRIPMPRDTPPPIPRAVQHHRNHRPVPTSDDKPSLTNANLEPLGHSSRVLPGPRSPPSSENNIKLEPKTVYESKPVVRDLRKEAVEKFVPLAVKRKLDARRGEGGRLLEEEEMSRLEKEGYGIGGVVGGRTMKGAAKADEEEKEGHAGMEDGVKIDENNKVQDEREEMRLREEEVRRLREEEERFERELAMEDEGKIDRAVTMEDVQDEDLQ